MKVRLDSSRHMIFKALSSGMLAALATAVSMSLACVGVSSVGWRSDPITLPPDRPLAFRDAENQLLVLNLPGRLYLLDFVAVGCKPCVEELPELVRLEQELGSSGRFQLVTVVYAWSGEALRTLGTSLHSGRLPLYGDTEECAQRLGVKGWPTKFLIRDGRVLLRSVGGGAGAYAKWRKIIERELEAETTARAWVSPPNYRPNPMVGPVTSVTCATAAPVPPPA